MGTGRDLYLQQPRSIQIFGHIRNSFRLPHSAFRIFLYFCGLMNLNDELPDC